MLAFGDAFSGAPQEYLDPSQCHMAARIIRDRRLGLWSASLRVEAKAAMGSVTNKLLLPLHQVTARRSHKRVDIVGIGF